MNHRIRVPRVRLIGADGNQVGIVDTREAMTMAQQAKLDLVEISPNANPPVCKIMDYGKFRYEQTKRERESKKAQHQVKIKEVKLRPNIDEHDFQTKLKRAREFLEKGNKVKVTCFFRGREMAHPEIGEKLVLRFANEVKDLGQVESPLKRIGRNMVAVFAPSKAKQR